MTRAQWWTRHATVAHWLGAGLLLAIYVVACTLDAVSR